MAALHGLLLAAILFFSGKLNATSNKFLSLSLFGIFIILFYEGVGYLEIENQIPLWFQLLPIYVRSSIPVGIFYFSIFLIQPKHSLNKFEKIGFLLIAIEISIELLHIPANLIQGNEALMNWANDRIMMVGEYFGLLACLILFPLSLQRVNRYQKYLYGHYSTTKDKSLGWLRTFIILCMGISLIWLISLVQYVLGFEEASGFTYLILTLGLIGSMFWIGYFIILYHNWFQIVPLPEKVDQLGKGANKLSQKTDTYHKSLIELMQQDKLYEDIDLTLENLAQSLQISSGYLSQIINEKEQKNFFEFVNLYRVESVKEKLLNPEFEHYTIMGIALESGFKSKSTFNSVFKKFTGQTPSTFKRQSKQKVLIP
ncbi:MAG: helix-turn-helix domain-containing protein [Bacteroidota bacterium]